MRASTQHRWRGSTEVSPQVTFMVMECSCGLLHKWKTWPPRYGSSSILWRHGRRSSRTRVALTIPQYIGLKAFWMFRLTATAHFLESRPPISCQWIHRTASSVDRSFLNWFFVISIPEVAMNPSIRSISYVFNILPIFKRHQGRYEKGSSLDFPGLLCNESLVRLKCPGNVLTLKHALKVALKACGCTSWTTPSRLGW